MSSTGVLLLCEVALGETNDLYAADYYASNLPAGKLSTKGIFSLFIIINYRYLFFLLLLTYFLFNSSTRIDVNQAAVLLPLIRLATSLSATDALFLAAKVNTIISLFVFLNPPIFLMKNDQTTIFSFLN